MGMHITSAWLILYSLVDSMLVYYCDKAMSGTGLAFELGGNETDLLPYAKPKVLYREGILPRLYPDLSLEDVSDKWSDKRVNCTRSERCIFAWVSRITANCMRAPQLNEIMENQMVANQWWEAVYDYFKLGFELTCGTKAKFVLELLNVSLPISEVMLTVVKSYGEKWSASKIRLEILNQRNGGEWERVRVTNPEVVGVHDKNTSEQYSSLSVFRKGPVGVTGDH
jgi:hypothetical protein